MAFVNLPPNLQDMFNGIYDRLSKLETGPNQAMYTAVYANEQASQAINEATQALAQATQAYNTASQSLIKNAYTITNADNQITGINSNGITVYSGASSSSGARVIMNSLGLVGYNSSNSPTFTLSASDGSFSTQGAIFTNSTIYGGSLNINGNATINSSGVLYANGATIIGTIYASAGSFAGTVTASSGQIGGFDIGSTYLKNPAGTIRLNSDTATATVASLTSSGSISAAGITNSGNLSMGGNNISNAAGITATGTISGSTLSASTNLTSPTATISGNLYTYPHQTTGSTANGYVNATSGLIARSTASSQRYKHDIVDLVDVPDLDPKLLYDLPVRAFRFNDGYLTTGDDREGVLVPGFIAEEVDAIYPAGTDYDNGQVETWNDRVIIPAMLSLIQQQNERIKTLEAKLSNP